LARVARASKVLVSTPWESAEGTESTRIWLDAAETLSERLLSPSELTW